MAPEASATSAATCWKHWVRCTVMRLWCASKAWRRQIDVVLVWRLDRWGRSVTDLLAALQELKHLGVGFVSLTEAPDLTAPAGRAMARVHTHNAKEVISDPKCAQPLIRVAALQPEVRTAAES